MRAWTGFVSLLALAVGALADYPNCQTIKIPLNVTAENAIITAPTPQTTTDVIKTVGIQVSLNGAANITQMFIDGTQSVSGTYYINSRLCLPTSNTDHESTVLLLIHGINGDMSYWDTSYDDFKYSFVVAAANAGYSTLAIDRLGIGGSSKPNGAKVVQTNFEVEIARLLASGLKSGSLGFSKGQSFSKVVAVGHSYGSIQSNLLINQTPDAVDAVVLTGFSHNATGQSTFQAATQPAIANQVNQTFSDLDNSYLLGSSVYGAQLVFFHEGGYDPTLGQLILKNPQTVTAGESFTMGQGFVPAYDFNGPVLIVTGAYDQPFCAGSCYGVNYPGIIESEAKYYTGSSQFSTYVVPNSGHFVNFHYGAPQAYSVITSFLSKNGL